MENEIRAVKQETFMYFPSRTHVGTALIPQPKEMSLSAEGAEKKGAPGDSLKEMKGGNKLFNLYLKLFYAQ